MIYIITDDDYSDYVILGLLEGPEDFDFEALRNSCKKLRVEKLIESLKLQYGEDKSINWDYVGLQKAYIIILTKEFGFKYLQHKMVNITGEKL